MGFSRITYNGREEIFETIVQDGTGRVIEKWKCMKKDYPSVLKILNKKLNLNLIIKEKKKTDLDWALD